MAGPLKLCSQSLMEIILVEKILRRTGIKTWEATMSQSEKITKRTSIKTWEATMSQSEKILRRTGIKTWEATMSQSETSNAE